MLSSKLKSAQKKKIINNELLNKNSKSVTNKVSNRKEFFNLYSFFTFRPWSHTIYV